MGWLRLVGSMKLQVSFAKEPYKRDTTLQKRPRIVSILLTVATPYWFNSRIRSTHSSWCYSPFPSRRDSKSSMAKIQVSFQTSRLKRDLRWKFEFVPRDTEEEQTRLKMHFDGHHRSLFKRPIWKETWILEHETRNGHRMQNNILDSHDRSLFKRLIWKETWILTIEDFASRWDSKWSLNAKRHPR